ncbi:MAG: hypothetical protein ACHQ1D_04855 [Nitrososphaerales archaeon]
MNKSRYPQRLDLIRDRAQGTAKEDVKELYQILTDEDKKAPFEARKIIQHDLGDIYTTKTILKHLPEECKEEAKVIAGKKSAEKRKEIFVTADGGEESVRSRRTEMDQNTLTDEEQEFSISSGNQGISYNKWSTDYKDNLFQQKQEKDVSPDCTNHLMYQKAQKRIEELDHDLDIIREEKIQLKEALEKQGIFLSASEIHTRTENFQIPKDCDFMSEHFKSAIEPIMAIQYLRSFVGKYQKIDFGFRVIE